MSALTGNSTFAPTTPPDTAIPKGPTGGIALTDLQGALEKELARAAASAWEAVRAFRDNVTQPTAEQVLRLATDHRAIAPTGLLVTLSHPGYRARFTLGDDQLIIRIENRSQHSLVECRWILGTSCRRVTCAINHRVGGKNNSMRQQHWMLRIFHGLVTALAVGIEARFSERSRQVQITRPQIHSSDLNPLIMVVNEQWAVTTYGLECIRHSYFIAAGRLVETDWQSHIAEKTWANREFVSDALEEARSIHGIEMARQVRSE